MKNKELTLEQALTSYLKALCAYVKQSDYTSTLSNDDLNELIAEIVAQIDSDYKEVFLYPQHTKKPAIYPTADNVAEFLTHSIFSITATQEQIAQVKEWINDSDPIKDYFGV